MQKALKALVATGAIIGLAAGGSFGVFALIVVLMLIAPLFGALTGLVVGWFFGPTILYTLGQMGLHGVEMWQLGMTLGFLGGFIRATQTTTNRDIVAFTDLDGGNADSHIQHH